MTGSVYYGDLSNSVLHAAFSVFTARGCLLEERTILYAQCRLKQQRQPIFVADIPDLSDFVSESCNYSVLILIIKILMI